MILKSTVNTINTTIRRMPLTALWIILIVLICSACTTKNWTRLSGSEAEALISGMTVVGYHEKDHYSFIRYYHPEGTFQSYNGGSTTPRPGRWWVNNSGQICIHWDDDTRDLCRRVMTADGHYWKVLDRRDGGEEIIVTYESFAEGNQITDQAIAAAGSIRPGYRPSTSASRDMVSYGIFGVIALIGLGTVISIRKTVTRSGVPLADKPPRLNPYEVACLAGDKNRAIDAAITRLILKGYLRARDGKPPALEVVTMREAFAEPDFLDSEKDTTKQASPQTEAPDQFSTPRNALERAIYLSIKNNTEGASIRGVHSSNAQEAQKIEDRLKDHGLLISDKQQRSVIVSLIALSVCMLIVGGIFGTFVLAVLYVVALFVFGRRLYRTDYGNRVLKTLQQQNAKRKNADPDMEPDFLVAGMALFGVSVLDGGPFEHLKTVFTPPRTSSSGGDGGCGG